MGEKFKPKISTVFRGKIFEVEQTEQPDGRVFERAVRAPGVRLIIADKVQRKLLLTREFRTELDGWDYRLPGGKVFDTLSEYDEFKAIAGDIGLAAERKAKAEGREEAGVDIEELSLYKKSVLGATMGWDLFVFEATSWRPAADGQELETGERIEADSWFMYDEAKKMALNGQMNEERVALVLLQWLETQKPA